TNGHEFVGSGLGRSRWCVAHRSMSPKRMVSQTIGNASSISVHWCLFVVKFLFATHRRPYFFPRSLHAASNRFSRSSHASSFPLRTNCGAILAWRSVGSDRYHSKVTFAVSEMSRNLNPFARAREMLH